MRTIVIAATAERRVRILFELRVFVFCTGLFMHWIGNVGHHQCANPASVQVKSGEITGIDIVEDIAAAGITNCSAEIFRRVIESQDTQNEAMSGATVTSKAYLKAVKNDIND